MRQLIEKIQILKQHCDIKSIIRDITKNGDQEDAFYVCDIDDIVKKHQAWTKALPRVQPFYAVKCNDEIKVLAILASLGVNFDCASKAEIAKILSLGIKPERIIFANPAKPITDIKFAAENGVNLLTFDSREELHKIKAYHPNAKLLIRIRSDATVSMCKLGAKFGCETVNEALEILKIAQFLNINVIGVCFHVGSGCEEPEAYGRAIKEAKELFVKAKQDLGLDFQFLDIGGGYPGEKGTSIDKSAEIINKSLDEWFGDYNNLKIISEPGRFYVCSAFTLATQIFGVNDENDNGEIIYFINDGCYGTFSILSFLDLEPIIPIPVKDFNNDREMCESIFWGPTYDHYDLVVKKNFPKSEIGDWVMFEDKGAYTFPLCTNFHGNDIPKAIYVASEEIISQLKFKNLQL